MQVFFLISLKRKNIRCRFFNETGLKKGDFQPGTSGYQFLKNIVDSVETQ